MAGLVVGSYLLEYYKQVFGTLLVALWCTLQCQLLSEVANYLLSCMTSCACILSHRKVARRLLFDNINVSTFVLFPNLLNLDGPDKCHPTTTTIFYDALHLESNLNYFFPFSSSQYMLYYNKPNMSVT